MKKLVLLVVFISIFVNVVSAEKIYLKKNIQKIEYDVDDDDYLKVKNSAFIIRPLPILKAK